MHAEGFDFRTQVLSMLFDALNNPQKPILNMRSLSIKNLQNCNDRTLISSQNFKYILRYISEPRLKIVTESDFVSPENSWLMPELYQFFEELADTWLKPAKQNLTNLTLHADLDWICSHTTLEFLILDGCSIVSHTLVYGPVDSEGYCANPLDEGGDQDYHRQHYPRRWSDLFAQIEAELPNLKQFQLGSRDWDTGRNSNTIDLAKLGMRSQDESCIAFDRRADRAPWIGVQEYLNDESEGNEDTDESKEIDVNDENDDNGKSEYDEENK
ncbi:hypothetical protein BKA65DRAFT_576405 [Rhexocercosporidium sp. MPI-PUGE-AT-0058]|nr:hypothetical protein BKA65DRAFT_576405 [Rhexocercosporidium sp. MPI-PUGE-AT-0058]